MKTLRDPIRVAGKALEPLFRESRSRRRPRSRTIPLGVLSLAGLVGILLLREGRGIRTLWAEDGAVYVHDALTQPFWSNLIRPYSGYDQLLPRLAVEVVRIVPLRDVSFVVTLVGAGLLAMLAIFIFYASSGHLDQPITRLVLVASVILLPIAPSELLGNLVNISWWLVFAAFWALMWRPQSWSGDLVAGLVCLLAAASDPVAGLLLPIAACRLVTLRLRDRQTATLGLVLGLVFQGVVILTAHASSSNHLGGTLSQFWNAFGTRIGLGWVTGVDFTDRLQSQWPQGAAAAGVALVVLIVVIGALRRCAAVRLFTVVGAALSIPVFVVPILLRGVAGTVAAKPVWFASRWNVVPLLIVVSVVLVWVDSIARSARRRRAWVLATIAILMVPAWVADFRSVNPRAVAPSWSAEVDASRGRCAERHVVSVDIEEAPPGWALSLPCRGVAGG